MLCVCFELVVVLSSGRGGGRRDPAVCLWTSSTYHDDVVSRSGSTAAEVLSSQEVTNVKYRRRTKNVILFVHENE